MLNLRKGKSLYIAFSSSLVGTYQSAVCKETWSLKTAGSDPEIIDPRLRGLRRVASML